MSMPLPAQSQPFVRPMMPLPQQSIPMPAQTQLPAMSGQQPVMPVNGAMAPVMMPAPVRMPIGVAASHGSVVAPVPSPVVASVLAPMSSPVAASMLAPMASPITSSFFPTVPPMSMPMTGAQHAPSSVGSAQSAPLQLSMNYPSTPSPMPPLPLPMVVNGTTNAVNNSSSAMATPMVATMPMMVSAGPLPQSVGVANPTMFSQQPPPMSHGNGGW